MSTYCAVCEGGGFVVWENGIPRKPVTQVEHQVADECPACDGSGIEPDGSDPAPIGADNDN